ncbi:MAG: hypothetical protein ACI8Z1_000215 [Candidatus Azotimanducaceae bacterium]|jgi:hypothetical protein
MFQHVPESLVRDIANINDHSQVIHFLNNADTEIVETSLLVGVTRGISPFIGACSMRG